MNNINLSIETNSQFETLWDFMCIQERPTKADYIVCLGSLDTNVPKYAAKLWHDGLASTIIMSGGIAHQDDSAKTPWKESEAAVFAKLAQQIGVPTEAILVEDKATNTAENFTLSEKIFKQQKGKTSTSILSISKPYMTRRARNTASKLFPEKQVTVTSYPSSLSDYLQSSTATETELHLIMGDMHRIMIYPQMGFMITDDVPAEVRSAFEHLIIKGYTKHLLRDGSGKILQLQQAIDG